MTKKQSVKCGHCFRSFDFYVMQAHGFEPIAARCPHCMRVTRSEPAMPTPPGKRFAAQLVKG